MPTIETPDTTETDPASYEQFLAGAIRHIQTLDRLRKAAIELEENLDIMSALAAELEARGTVWPEGSPFEGTTPANVMDHLVNPHFDPAMDTLEFIEDIILPTDDSDEEVLDRVSDLNRKFDIRWP